MYRKCIFQILRLHITYNEWTLKYVGAAYVLTVNTYHVMLFTPLAQSANQRRPSSMGPFPRRPDFWKAYVDPHLNLLQLKKSISFKCYSDYVNQSIRVTIDQFFVFTKGILGAKYQAFI